MIIRIWEIETIGPSQSLPVPKRQVFLLYERIFQPTFFPSQPKRRH